MFLHSRVAPFLPTLATSGTSRGIVVQTLGKFRSIAHCGWPSTQHFAGSMSPALLACAQGMLSALVWMVKYWTGDVRLKVQKGEVGRCPNHSPPYSAMKEAAAMGSSAVTHLPRPALAPTPRLMNSWGCCPPCSTVDHIAHQPADLQLAFFFMNLL